MSDSLERLELITKIASKKEAKLSKSYQDFYGALRDAKRRCIRLVKLKPTAELKSALAYLEEACRAAGL